MKINRYLEVLNKDGDHLALHRLGVPGWKETRFTELLITPFRREAAAAESTLEEWIDDAECGEEWSMLHMGYPEIPVFSVMAVVDEEDVWGTLKRTVTLKRI